MTFNAVTLNRKTLSRNDNLQFDSYQMQMSSLIDCSEGNLL